MLTLLRVTLALSVLPLIGIAVGALLGAWIPAFVLFQAFTLQVAALSAITAVLALALGLRHWALVSAVLALWQGSLVLPFVWRGDDAAVTGAPLRVLSINLWRNNATPDVTLDYLLSSGADVIGTLEATPEWRQRLKALKTVYPYHVDCEFSHVPCWAALFSKHPIRRASADTIDNGAPIVVWAEIEWQGAPVSVGAVQVSNPMIGLERGRQEQLANNLARYVGALPGDAVLLGDFNSTPWGTLQNDFRDRTGFDNRGRMVLTWPSWAPALARLPIDQIFTRGALALRDYRVGPDVGSDHLPVLGEVFRSPR